MQATAEMYLDQTQVRSRISADVVDIVTYRAPSFGTVSTNSPVTTFFGMPTKLTPKGVVVDMDRIASISVEKANNTQKWISFNQADGSAGSRTESGVLEQQYSTPSQPLSGVSAVQALSVADSQGQRVYSINASNAGTAMASLNLSNPVMQDIANSVNAGLTVTTDQSPINYAGQTTTGYIILDPATGAAAYKIASGADGGGIVIPEWLSVVFDALADIGAHFKLLIAKMYGWISDVLDAIDVITKCSPTALAIIIVPLAYMIFMIYLAAEIAVELAGGIIGIAIGALMSAIALDLLKSGLIDNYCGSFSGGN